MVLIFDPNHDPKLQVQAERVLRIDCIAFGYVFLDLNTISIYLLKDLSDMEINKLIEILRSDVHFRRDAPDLL
jgi:hypothetical protein